MFFDKQNKGNFPIFFWSVWFFVNANFLKFIVDTYSFHFPPKVMSELPPASRLSHFPFLFFSFKNKTKWNRNHFSSFLFRFAKLNNKLIAAFCFVLLHFLASIIVRFILQYFSFFTLILVFRFLSRFCVLTLAASLNNYSVTIQYGTMKIEHFKYILCFPVLNYTFFY